MVIQHFNKIIRNKWIWGVFAVAISAFFAFDFLIADLQSDSGRDRAGSAGLLADKDVTMAEFRAVADDLRGIGRNRSNEAKESEVNQAAWESLAALRVAANLNLTASDAEVREAIAQDPSFRGENGVFNLGIYQMVLRENGLTPEHFENYLKRRITLTKLNRVVMGSATWISPMELNRAIDDMTDTFTVKLAYYDEKEAGTPKLDDKALEAYYKDNTNSIAMPDCISVRYVAFKADDPARLAAFKVTDDELKDHYDATQSRFETQTTNGVITKKFEEVKPILLRELQLLASLEAYRTNLLFRVYPADGKAAEKGSRLDAIAKAEKAQVLTSPLFSAEGKRPVLGFMSTPRAFAADAEGFAAAAAELDPDSEDLRYGVVAGTNRVYLMERAQFVKAHVPAFAEAKNIIRPNALADAKAKAFKAAVEKKRALAAAALAKGGTFDAKTAAALNVTTSYVFSVSSLKAGAFPDSMYAATAVMKLNKGQISDFVPVSMGKGVLVYVENRKPGDAASAQMIRSQIRDELSSFAAQALPVAWNKWNLSRMGFEAEPGASVENADESSVSED